MTDLLPCPFGCSRGTEMAYGGVPQHNHYPDNRYRLHCTCGAVGPHGNTSKEAIAAWNLRAAPASPEGAELGLKTLAFDVERAAASVAHLVDEYTQRGWNDQGRAKFAAMIARRLRRFSGVPK